jgi:hypothetical protein
MIRLRSLLLLLVILCAFGTYLLHLSHTSFGDSFTTGQGPSKHLNDFIQSPASITPMSKFIISSSDMVDNPPQTNPVEYVKGDEASMSSSSQPTTSPVYVNDTQTSQEESNELVETTAITIAEEQQTAPTMMPVNETYEKPEWKRARLKHAAELESVLGHTNKLYEPKKGTIKPLDEAGLNKRRYDRKERQRNGWRRTTLENRKHPSWQVSPPPPIESKAQVVGMSTDNRLKPNALILFPMPGDSSLAFTTAVAQSAREVSPYISYLYVGCI